MTHHTDAGQPGTFPTWTPLPQNLQNHGILTLGVGKYFHDVNKALGKQRL